MAESLFSSGTGWLRQFARVRLEGNLTCPVQVYQFNAPHSYTGQDMIEMHLPGAVPLLEMTQEALLAAGARSAEPGEFTARAFFHGRLDLSQAEAVAEMIAARSDAQLRGAARLLDGALRRQTDAIAERLADLLARIEADIDFSDQELDDNHPGQTADRAADLADRVDSIRRLLADLLLNSQSWQELHHLGRVVVAGAVNAGKSSLVNALLGWDRSIVNSLAGTTRDLLTGPLQLEHTEVLLIDTAGLGCATDPLAESAQNQTRRALQTADLVIWLVDGSDARSNGQIEADLALAQEAVATVPILTVLNKLDACSDPAERLRQLHSHRLPPAGSNYTDHPKANLKADFKKDHAQGDLDDPIFISALKNRNLDVLRQRIQQHFQLGGGDASGEALALTIRQRQALQDAAECLSEAGGMLKNPEQFPPEIMVLPLREALDQISAISGGVIADEILGRIFSRFCIGK